MSAIFELNGHTWLLRPRDVCGRVRFQREWSSGTEWWRTLQDYDLWFVWTGRGTMQLETQKIPLYAGSCIWMHPGRRYITTHDPEHPLGVNFFHFDVFDERGSPAGPRFTPPLERMRVLHLAFADCLMQRILALRSEPGGRETGDALFAALLTELVRDASRQAKLPAGIRQEHVTLVHEVMSEIRAAPATVVSVAQLARRHGYSVSHFSRVFEAVAGARPQHFIINARLDHARELLSMTSKSVGEIAAAAGFSDIYYFSRLFKQRTGISPSAFRQNLART
ncbi:MAG: helix-turn-helix transcriptional regulator [Opitutaceae bacterium]|nr:helix-turn-helix transcriptional regulator [Opitutaceae bacterium]